MEYFTKNVNLVKYLISNGEKIRSRFQVRDFSSNLGAKTGVMQGIMRIFVTTSRAKRSTLNREVILSTLLNDQNGILTLLIIRIYQDFVSYMRNYIIPIRNYLSILRADQENFYV